MESVEAIADAIVRRLLSGLSGEDDPEEGETVVE
jgi:hypothetical protein